MNNVANSLVQRLKVYLAFVIRYIVFIGRKYPLIAVAIILLYGLFFYQSFFRKKVAQNNLPLPTQSSSPSTSSTNSSTTTINNQLQNNQLQTDAEIEERLKEQEIAKLEEKQRQEKQKRIEAAQAVFKQGRVFDGQLIYQNQSQPIHVEISAVVGSTYVVEISNPQQNVTQIFEGKLTEEFKHESLKYSPEKLSPFLSLKSRSPQDLPDNIWRFYRYQTTLILATKELGIDGLADSLVSFPANPWDYSIVIRDKS